VENITVDVLNNRGATVSVSRAVKNFGDGIEVFASIPVELPDEALFPEPADFLAAKGEALRQTINFLKVQVFDALGLEYTDEKGIITERVAKAFAPEPRPRSTFKPVTPDSADPGPTPAPATPAADGEKACPNCGGAMWDNRASKKNPKQPDFKCKDKGCEGVIWPPRAR
jgi:hypothetical protein